MGTCSHTNELTCRVIIACLVHLAKEEFQANDGIDNNNEYDEKSNMEER